MMNNNISSGKKVEAKQEGGGGGDDGKEMIRKSAATSSRQWGGFKNPRIVRVSQSLGGKDRHSKVCTIRGLRDRRIRLSVPTAIQLYDLQDRLGLSQPSKVVDWLLDATKLEIDKLPPLHFPHQFQELFPPHQLDNESPIWKTLNGKEKLVEDNGGVLPYNNNNNFFPFPFMNNHWGETSILPPQFHHHSQNNNNNLYFPSIIPQPYMAAAEAAAAADPRHLINTHLVSQHDNFIQNPMIPPTLHFIKSYANTNDNPGKSSRGS